MLYLPVIPLAQIIHLILAISFSLCHILFPLYRVQPRDTGLYFVSLCLPDTYDTATRRLAFGIMLVIVGTWS